MSFPPIRLTRAAFPAVIAALLVGLLLRPPATSANAAAPSDVPHLQSEKFTLPNGLQVILHVDRKLPMVNVNSWYHVGSKNERAGRTGFAHLFEHMMFEGSKNADGKYLSRVEQAGANLFEGGVNGTTNEDRTNYFETVPAANLEYILWLESDRLATLTEVLTKNKLDNERAIVKNERRQSVENRPYGRSEILIPENLFPLGHPYAHSVIGSHEDLTAATVEDVTDFFHTYYTPNNLSLAITGDFDPAKVKALVTKYFGPIPPGPPLDRPKRWVPKISGTKLVEVNDHVPQERSYFAWPTPAFFEAGDAELDLVSLILTDGLSSRLSKALIYDRQLCSDVISFQNSQEIGSTFMITATARPGVPLPRIERAVTDELERLAKQGPEAEELARAKAKWESQYLTGLERIGGFGGQADLLNMYNTFLGDPDKFAADVERHRAVTADGLQRAAAAWLRPSDLLLVRFHPEAAELPQTTAVVRSKAPAFGPDQRFTAPQVKTASLENGVKLFVLERPDLPKVSVVFATRAGSVDDEPGREGAASLAVETMKRGTKTRNALAIDNELGDLGTALEAHSDREYSLLSCDVLKRNLSPALAVLADVARNPSFPPAEVDREQKKRLDELAQTEADPGRISRRLTTVLAFGREHPYGRPVQGFRSSVTGLTRADLVRSHDTYWKPGSSALVLVGDVTLDEAVAVARQCFGSWSGGAAPAIAVGPPHPLGAGKTYLVDRPDAAQTFISEILPAPVRNSPEYYPLALADAVWGGAAGARLGMNLREEKGYSYGVFSTPLLLSKSALWVARGGVQSDKTKESIVEFQKELRNIAGQKPVSEQELADAKNHQIRGYAQQFESLRGVATQIVQLWSLGLPISELQREPEQLERTKLDAVNGVAEKYATPSRAMLLLVGDAAKLEPQLRQINGNELVRIDVEGKPVNR